MFPFYSGLIFFFNLIEPFPVALKKKKKMIRGRRGLTNILLVCGQSHEQDQRDPSARGAGAGLGGQL